MAQHEEYSESSLPPPMESAIDTMLPFLATTTATDDSSECDHANNNSLAWHDADATSLAPTSLAMRKVQRAWDRKPQSPYSRRRFKVGKIFKRSVTNSFPSAGFTVQIRDSGSESMSGKAVKRQRVVAGDGFVGTMWESGGSPINRRIVTRSSAAVGEDELLALEEEEPEEEEEQDNSAATSEVNGEEADQEADVDGTQIEILNEDGTQRDDAPDSLEADEWEYESATEVDESEASEEAWERCRQDARRERELQGFSSQSSQLASSAPEASPAHVVPNGVFEDQPAGDGDATSELLFSASQLGSIATTSQLAHDFAPEVIETSSEPTLFRGAPIPPSMPIPAGFVSPVAERRRRPISLVRQANTSRRRTLPVDFAAKTVTPDQSIAAAEGETAVESEVAEADHEAGIVTTETTEMPETLDADETDAEKLPSSVPAEVTPEQDKRIPEPNTPTTENATVVEATAAVHAQRTLLMSPSKVPGSPIPTIDGPHLRLPLRRSPRRQSTSPWKGKGILKQTLVKPHLVAFTPIKRTVDPQTDYLATGFPSSPFLPGLAGSPSAASGEVPGLARSSSAPPEEPQMSPRKPKQPRISDDTALLEAFLKRASESRTGRAPSDTAKKESFERRRESGTVRQALASPEPNVSTQPVQTDVLAERNPNSPSPRKAGLLTEADVDVDLKYERQDPIRDDDEDELAADSGPARKFGTTRKSSRVRKKPADTLPSTTFDGRKSIQIRGAADGVVLKKSEAQELANETKKNTMNNKSGCVLPPLRLKRMALEATLQQHETGAMDGEKDTEKDDKKSVRWNETLVSFYQGDNIEPELSMLVDEAEPVFDAFAPDNNVLTEGEMSFITALPASQTPSRPRTRKVKKSVKVAETTASEPEPQPESARQPPSEFNTLSKPTTITRRRISRIATPAKVKGQTVLGKDPDDADTMTTTFQELKPRLTPGPGTAASKRSAVTTKTMSEDRAPPSQPTTTTAKKAAASKLPAPSGHGLSSSTGNKENSFSQSQSLISSPPKKRVTKLGSSTTSSAPALKFGDGLASKLEFSAPKKESVQEDVLVPGLMSPAKKAPRLMPGRETKASGGGGTEEGGVPMTLSSPAKKRGDRRMI